ncbi:MAG: hypothetical protein ACJ750_07270 [Gaiellaceae bacterium]
MTSVIVTGMLCLALVTGCGVASQPLSDGVSDGAKGNVVARLGESETTAEEVRGLLAETKRLWIPGRPFPKVGSPYWLDLRDEAVSFLVQREARFQAAEDRALDVTEAEIDSYVTAGEPYSLARAASEQGMEMSWVRAYVRDHLLDVELYEYVLAHAQTDNEQRRELSDLRRAIERAPTKATYAPGWKPARKRRSPIPPDLVNMPRQRDCDLAPGMYTSVELIERGCAGGNTGMAVPGRDGEPCPEVPPDILSVGDFGEPVAYDDYISEVAEECVPYPSFELQVGGPRR